MNHRNQPCKPCQDQRKLVAELLRKGYTYRAILEALKGGATLLGLLSKDKLGGN